MGQQDFDINQVHLRGTVTRPAVLTNDQNGCLFATFRISVHVGRSRGGPLAQPAELTVSVRGDTLSHRALKVAGALGQRVAVWGFVYHKIPRPLEVRAEALMPCAVSTCACGKPFQARFPSQRGCPKCSPALWAGARAESSAVGAEPGRSR
jgi:hypothetical protein